MSYLYFAGAQPNGPTNLFSYCSSRDAGLLDRLDSVVGCELKRTLANSACSTADWAGVVRVRVRFFLGAVAGGVDISE